jgi:hypothetical protein
LTEQNYMTTSTTNAKPPRRASYANLCSDCGQDFGGVTAFDMHRVGRHDLDYPEHLDGRRCLSEDEIRTRGLVQTAHGRWGQPQNGLPERMGSRSQREVGDP